jgi:hypothetical protein
MPHEVFVGVAKDVVVLGAILGEIERGFSKMAIRLPRRSTRA